MPNDCFPIFWEWGYVSYFYVFAILAISWDVILYKTWVRRNKISQSNDNIFVVIVYT